MSNRGRPRASNDDLELKGSRNIKVDQIDSQELILSTLPPNHLSEEAKSHWRLIVPPLVAAGTVKEADRMLLTTLCADCASFHDRSVDKEGNPTIDEKDRQRIGKRILDTSDKFGMNPLARQRSGINKKTQGVKTRQ